MIWNKLNKGKHIHCAWCSKRHLINEAGVVATHNDFGRSICAGSGVTEAEARVALDRKMGISEMAEVIVKHIPARSYRDRWYLDLWLYGRSISVLASGLPEGCWASLSDQVERMLIDRDGGAYSDEKENS